MRAGVVDIGTNSMRLLITDGVEEAGRWVEVTGLGQGVDATGRLEEDAVARTLAALRRFGDLMDGAEVSRRAAMATSATRDASNRDEFLTSAERALGVRPEVVDGAREGRLAYAGATSDMEGDGYLVSDIGGGSTEFVTSLESMSIDIGSVRLTDRLLTSRPAPVAEMERARAHVLEMFSGVGLQGDSLGVAGTWTSLAAIDLDLSNCAPAEVHHHRITVDSLAGLTTRLAGMTIEETRAIPSLDPARAPVILAGAVIAGCVLEVVAAETVLICERDTLDGLAGELLALT